MVSNIEAAKAGVTYAPSVWEVAEECYRWISPTDPVPDIALPEGWELQHRGADGNPSDV